MTKIHWFILLTVTSFLFQNCVSTKRFSNTTLVKSTKHKHQKYTGQCWSFASTSLLEAEAIRLGYDIPELSSFFFVYHNYLDNARDYLKNKGKSRLNRGDLTFSVLEVFQKHGAMPEAIYSGKLKDVVSKRQMLGRMKAENEMNALIKTKLDSLIKVGAEVEASLKVVREILNREIGMPPKTFEYQQNRTSPLEFAKKYAQLDAQNYVELTSYSHHPFYKKVMLEIPANWRFKTYLNLPIEDFMRTIDSAIYKGYTLAWDGCIRNSGGFRDNGYVKVKGEYENEKIIKQTHRQSAYKRKTTTDDHNMHLVGITYDRDGQKFYILKNTWGTNRGLGGSWYLSERYFRLRTVSVTVHKDAIEARMQK